MQQSALVNFWHKHCKIIRTILIMNVYA